MSIVMHKRWEQLQQCDNSMTGKVTWYTLHACRFTVLSLTPFLRQNFTIILANHSGDVGSDPGIQGLVRDLLSKLHSINYLHAQKRSV
jgi:predicted site-specific integrase-resolvase